VADDIDTRLAEWEARLDRLEENEEERAVPSGATGSYVLFVPAPSGYQLVERSGSVPAPGDVLALEEGKGRYVVSRVIRSPLPDDTRPCVNLALI
jgi:hypothetical protein